MLKTIRLAALASVITFTPFALSGATAEGLKVVASFSIIADFARNVGGESIELTTLVGPNGDAHVYEPKPADAAAMSDAQVVLVNGLNFEGFLERLVEASGSQANVVELTKGVEPITMKQEDAHVQTGEAEESHDHQHGDIDPHAFQSIANAKIYVQNIADAFCAADAAGCEAYKANAAAYTEKLDATEAEVKEAIASIPQDKRVVISSHDAFGYFEHAYGLTFLSPEGISTEAEASAADVAALIRQVKEDNASAIFVENVTNPRLIEQIASETGLKVGGTLYSDALSGPGGGSSTYLDLMRHNASTIKGAILGS
jgi:zinc/manganese transport system substrate-binding protein